MESARSIARRPFPGLAWTCAAVAGVCILVCALVARSAAASWRELETWAETASLEWEAREFRRQPLWGEALPGSATESYREATELAQAWLEEDEELRLALMHRPAEIGEDRAAELRARWAPLLKLVREGAHRENVRPAIQPRRGYDNPVQRLMMTRLIANVAGIEARWLRAEGRGHESVEVLLDTATLGADMTRSPMLVDPMIGVAVVRISTSAAWTDEALRELDEHALAFLAQGLERLDRALPETVRYEDELLLLANHFVHRGAIGPADADLCWTSPYRFASYRRWKLASTFDELLAVARERADQAVLSWPERRALLEQLENWPRGAGSMPVFSSAELSLRSCLAEVRLLRLAVDAHLGREMAPLNDPLGDGHLTIDTTDAGPRFRSAGERGNGYLERVASLR